jgi:hypothetical protein
MIDPKYKIPENTVSFQPMPQSYYFCLYRQLTSSILYRSMIHHRRSAEVVADRTSPIGPDLFDRQQRAKLGGFNAPGCALQENYHQASEDIPIGSRYCFGTSFQGKLLTSSTYTDSIPYLHNFFRTHRLLWELHR